MIISAKCKCGNVEPLKFKEYEGALGYEAVICTLCGRYSDHAAEHEADEFSIQQINGGSNMGKHTPGDWQVDTWEYPNAKPPRKELIIRNGDFRLAVIDCDFTGGNPYTIPQAQAEANARLFAAAPSLLDALKFIQSRLQDGDTLSPYALHETDDDKTVLDQINEAIAQAEGKP